MFGKNRLICLLYCHHCCSKHWVNLTLNLEKMQGRGILRSNPSIEYSSPAKNTASRVKSEMIKSIDLQTKNAIILTPRSKSVTTEKVLIF